MAVAACEANRLETIDLLEVCRTRLVRVISDRAGKALGGAVNQVRPASRSTAACDRRCGRYPGFHAPARSCALRRSSRVILAATSSRAAARCSHA